MLSEMRADGTYQELMDRYGATQIDVWEKWSGDFEVFFAPES